MTPARPDRRDLGAGRHVHVLAEPSTQLTPANGATTCGADPDLDACRGRGQVLRHLDRHRRRVVVRLHRPRTVVHAPQRAHRGPHLPLAGADHRDRRRTVRHLDAAGRQPTFTVAAQAAPTATTPDPTERADALDPASRPYVEAGRAPTTYRCTCARSGWHRGSCRSGRRSSTRPPRTPATQFLVGRAATTGSSTPSTAALRSPALRSALHHRVAPRRTAARPSRATITGQRRHRADTVPPRCPNECQNLRQTPVLTGTRPRRGLLQAVLVLRRRITNPCPSSTASSTGTCRSTPVALPDSQAGSAYYWEAVPCRAGACAPIEHASHAFNKQSNQVVLTRPVTTAARSTRPRREQRRHALVGGPSGHRATAATTDTALTPPARTEAQQYRVQISTDPNFQSSTDGRRPDDVHVLRKHLSGGPIYWRVQAIDASSNPHLERPAGRSQQSPARLTVLRGGPRTTGGQLAEDPDRHPAVHLGRAAVRRVRTTSRSTRTTTRSGSRRTNRVSVNTGPVGRLLTDRRCCRRAPRRTPGASAERMRTTGTGPWSPLRRSPHGQAPTLLSRRPTRPLPPSDGHLHLAVPVGQRVPATGTSARLAVPATSPRR